MTKLLTFLTTACLFLSPARAGQTNLLNLTYVNGTNNGNTFTAAGIYVPPQKFLIQNLGITNVASGSFLTNGVTNVLSANVQISVDPANSNWITLATYYPLTTNGLVDSFNPNFNAISLPMRLQIVTSNATAVSVFLVQ